VQNKRAIQEPGDRYEQEAERVAGEVMAMADPRPLPLRHLTSSESVETEASPAVGDVVQSPGADTSRG
jgi:hypothetical protein